ncbi:MAG: ABC transporter ATP-binding protein [Bacillus sp. (in: Bacteria)]|nr:ABC transporter ATP-binding protein [Bacillus sp. (in: firmicutes)]
MALLEVTNLSISFQQYAKGFRQKQLKVIHQLSLRIEEGEILAVVGSSGSGKSLLAHAILGILPANASVEGDILFEGEPLTEARQLRMRGKQISLIPQSVNFLDPLMKIGKQVRGTSRGEAVVSKVSETLGKYQLGPEVENLFPFQLSGGMARRVLVSTAVLDQPKLIIADEPTPGLDDSVVKAALASFEKLKEAGSSILFITHDIQSALAIADKIAVFYAGTTVEVAPVEDFSGSGENLRHPYSKALWRALPQNEFLPIPGTQPQGDNLPIGCVFAPRCNEATEECTVEVPEVRNLRSGMVRCIHAT